MNRNKELRLVEPPAAGIGTASNPREVASLLALQLPAPGHIADLNIFCGCDNPGQVLCLVDVQDIPASEAAQALDGVPFAFTSVVLTLTPGPNFTCRMGRPGFPDQLHCSCSAGLQPSAPGIDIQ
jgi:hypothetical protein